MTSAYTEFAQSYIAQAFIVFLSFFKICGDSCSKLSFCNRQIFWQVGPTYAVKIKGSKNSLMMEMGLLAKQGCQLEDSKRFAKEEVKPALTLACTACIIDPQAKIL
jgi:hypothetical protein